MSEQTAAAPKRRRVTTWPGLLVSCVIAFGWSFFQAASHEPDAALREADNAYKFGYLLGGIFGQSVVIALIIWLVLYFAFVRSRAPDRGGPHFLALFGSAIGGGLVFVGLIAVVLATGADEREAIGAVLDDYGAAVVALDNDLAADVTDVTGSGGLMDTIESRDDLPEVRERLEALLPRLDEGEADVEALQAQTIRRLEQAGVSERDIADYREGQAEANALRTRAISLMRRIVETNLEQITVLENAGNWRISTDDSIVFPAGSDISAFNANAARLMELEAEGYVLQADVEAFQAENGQAAPPRP